MEADQLGEYSQLYASEMLNSDGQICNKRSLQRNEISSLASPEKMEIVSQSLKEACPC